MVGLEEDVAPADCLAVVRLHDRRPQAPVVELAFRADMDRGMTEKARYGAAGETPLVADQHDVERPQLPEDRFGGFRLDRKISWTPSHKSRDTAENRRAWLEGGDETGDEPLRPDAAGIGRKGAVRHPRTAGKQQGKGD
jgi:hypothetical protein